VKRFEFWFEFASTYSYPAAMRVEHLVSGSDIELLWRPFLLGPIFGAQGWNDSPFNLYPAKGSYMWRDLERICVREGLPLRRPSVFPRNGLHAARVACWFDTEPWTPEFVRQVYLANFARDLDISRGEVLAELVRSAGGPAAAVLDRAGQPDSKQKLRSQTERAIALGIFGAPSVTVGSELFWGNDRLEEALAWARRDASQSD